MDPFVHEVRLRARKAAASRYTGQKEKRRFESKDDNDRLHACRTGNGKYHEEPRHGQEEQLDVDVVLVLHLAHECVETGERGLDVLHREHLFVKETLDVGGRGERAHVKVVGSKAAFVGALENQAAHRQVKEVVYQLSVSYASMVGTIL